MGEPPPNILQVDRGDYRHRGRTGFDFLIGHLHLVLAKLRR